MKAPMSYKVWEMTVGFQFRSYLRMVLDVSKLQLLLLVITIHKFYGNPSNSCYDMECIPSLILMS